MTLSLRSRPIALCALYGVLSVIFCWPLFEHPQGLGANDWDQHLFYYGVVLKNVVEYGQLPFWNPWYCAGDVMWQNPQIAILSPVYPLTMVMSLQLAMKVNIVLHYWLGFIGMHLLLTRIIGVTFLPAVIYLATLVTASGAPAIHLRVGHSVFLPGFYLPWQIYFFFRAFKTGEWKHVLLAGATMALMIFNGGTHILPMSIAALGTFTLCAAVAKRDWRPVVVMAVFGVSAIAYSAPKLLPVVNFVSSDYFSDTRDATEHPDRMTLALLEQTYLVPTQDVGARLPLQRHGWHEYGNYIGLGSAAALLIGLIVVFVRRSSQPYWFGVSLAITTLMLFLLSLGEFSGVAPATLSHSLPLFSSFRIPSRYSIPFLQFATLTLAWAFQGWIRDHGLPRAAKWTVGVLAIAGAAHLIAVNQWNFKGVFAEPAFDTSFHWMQGPHAIATDTESSPYTKGSPMLRALMEDTSFLNCYESLQLARGAGAGPLVVDRGPSSRVASTDFTPNRMTFTLHPGQEAAVIALNQNWSPGWTSTAGVLTPPRPTELPTITMAPNASGSFGFAFVPPGIIAGSVVFVAALAATAFAWRRRMSPIA